MKQVNTKQELIEAILLHREKIAGFGVQKIGFFGSFVKNTVNENSDVDLFIEFAIESKTLSNFVGLANFLRAEFGRKVEIVTPQSLNPFTGKYITQEVEYVPFAA